VFFDFFLLNLIACLAAALTAALAFALSVCFVLNVRRRIALFDRIPEDNTSLFEFSNGEWLRFIAIFPIYLDREFRVCGTQVDSYLASPCLFVASEFLVAVVTDWTSMRPFSFSHLSIDGHQIVGVMCLHDEVITLLICNCILDVLAGVASDGVYLCRCSSSSLVSQR